MAEVDVYIPTCCGRDWEITGTVESLTERVHGNIGSMTIIDDSGNPEYGDWLVRTFGGRFRIVHNERNLGYREMMARAWDLIAGTDGAPYVMWSEDDFSFERDVNLDDLIAVLEHDNRLAQVVLLREAFYPREIRAGSIPKEHPGSYTLRRVGPLRYLEHRRFYSCNPGLLRRDIFKVARWPETGEGSQSEALMGPRLVNLGYRFAYFGSGEPWIRHTGRERVVV